MEVRMALVARMTKEPVTSVGVQAAGMHAPNWTTGQFMMWDWPTLGKLVERLLENPLGLHPHTHARMLSTREPLGWAYACRVT